MGKLVLYLAVSVDGYLADEQGGVGWLGGDGSEPENFRQLPRLLRDGGGHSHGLVYLPPDRHGALPGQLAL